MARTPRRSVDHAVYHVLNRGNCRMHIFDKPMDYAAFVQIIEQGRQRFPGVRILGYCLMPNHWHFVLWPKRGDEMSRFIGWISSTHVRRWREHHGNVGEGHLYQGRFKSFLIQEDAHLMSVLRYVEANPFRSKLVERAQDWPWSSLNSNPGVNGIRIQLADCPVDRPRNWVQLVNAPIDEKVIGRVRTSILRNRPFGDDRWITQTAHRHKLESTIRDPWRPKKGPVTRAVNVSQKER